MPQVLERLVLQVELLAALCETAVYRADVRTHTGRTAQAGEGVESRDGLGDERTAAAQACSGTEWYRVRQCY